uniref:Uncharacterized protein n=1 Tax=virus sp. ct1Hk25 TaxID=2825803 RepID=A0A8S5RNY4_9VIRU|nr:MAG TPA: hypothetical protein [virus sp. ct1Hk25]DAV77850.1 MAG TPA: hypothetical protein [Bacteriophage sp.]
MGTPKCGRNRKCRVFTSLSHFIQSNLMKKKSLRYCFL